MASPATAQTRSPLFEGVTPYHWLVFFGCWLGGIFDGMDSTLYAVVQSDAIMEVAGVTARADISNIGSKVLGVFLIGWVVGGFAFGVIGDKFGRVKAMVLSILLYALFTGASGFAQDPTQLAICRFLTGMGIGGELVTIATMLSEVWPERSRAFAVGSLITSYQVGVFLAGLIPTWIYNTFADGELSPWRIVFFIGALPAVLAILVRTRLEEPEKWKQDKEKRHEKIEWGHGFEQFRSIFKKEFARDLFVGGAAFGGLLVGYWASLAWVPTWIQDLIGPNGTGTEKSIAMTWHGFAAVAGCLLSGPLANTIGRKWTIMIAYLGSFATSYYMFSSHTTFSEAIYVEYALLGFFIGLSQAIMYIYLPELFPTRIRATAVGFCLNVGRIVTAIAVFNVGLVVKFFGGYAVALIVFALPYLISVLAGAIGRETRGQTLPD